MLAACLVPLEMVDRMRRPDPFDRPTDAVIAALAAGQHGRVATRQLVAAGVTPTELRRRVAGGRLHRVHRGVYAVGHPGATQDAVHMAAVLCCGPRALLAARSLAHHHGLLRGPAPALVDVAVGGRSRAGAPGIRVHLPHRLTVGESTVVRGVPCTTVERMVVDLAADATDAELADVVHRAQVRGLLREDRMAAQLARPARGVARVRELIEPSGPDLRGAFETRFAAFVRDGGWPGYEPNVRMRTSLGDLRLDALWRHERFGVELDSWRHHGGREAFETDRRRVVAASLLGITVARVTWRMLTGTPEVLAALLDHHVGRSNASS